jgi:hypothetical protein
MFTNLANELGHHLVEWGHGARNKHIFFDKAPGIFMGSWMIMGYCILPSRNLTVMLWKMRQLVQ